MSQSVVVEREISDFCLQQHKRKRLNLVNQLMRRAFVAVEDTIVSFFPNSPSSSIANQLQNGLSRLRIVTTNKTKLIEVIRRHTRDDGADTQPTVNNVPDFPKKITM